MKYRYTAIYSIKGVSLPCSEGDKELVVDSAIGLRAVLTSQPDFYSSEGDRSLAVASLMLNGLFRSEPAADEFRQRIMNAAEDIKQARKKEFGGDPFLVVIGEGEVPSFNPLYERDAEDFIVCCDGADKDAIRKQFHPTITAIMNAITSEADNVIGINKVTDSIVFVREDGKSIYSYSFSMGSVKAYVSKSLAEEQVRAIGQLYRLFATDKTLQRVQRLIRSSFEAEEDSLRSFLAVWSAFEIFVNKVFDTYEERFFKRILEEGYSEAQRKYLKRVREVMQGKYQLADKFAAIGFQLSPVTADEDLKTVMQVKKIRDKLSHGESVDETTLPVKPIRDLASKYLRLHSGGSGTAERSSARCKKAS